MTSIDNMYKKNILVRLTNGKTEEKFKKIHITVDYQTTHVPNQKKVFDIHISIHISSKKILNSRLYT